MFIWYIWESSCSQVLQVFCAKLRHTTWSSSRTWGGRMNVLSPQTKPIVEALGHLQGASITSNKIVSEWTELHWSGSGTIDADKSEEELDAEPGWNAHLHNPHCFFLVMLVFLNCSWKLGTRGIEDMGRRHQETSWCWIFLSSKASLLTRGYTNHVFMSPCNWHWIV